MYEIYQCVHQNCFAYVGICVHDDLTMVTPFAYTCSHARTANNEGNTSVAVELVKSGVRVL